MPRLPDGGGGPRLSGKDHHPAARRGLSLPGGDGGPDHPGARSAGWPAGLGGDGKRTCPQAGPGQRDAPRFGGASVLPGAGAFAAGAGDLPGGGPQRGGTGVPAGFARRRRGVGAAHGAAPRPRSGPGGGAVLCRGRRRGPDAVPPGRRRVDVLRRQSGPDPDP
ncbi:hypothetical protein B5G12_06440 [Faecalibacterium sp. An58]|nr:hypothetical protein B5G12_06440 [Faecalibacterium sp. An58]